MLIAAIVLSEYVVLVCCVTLWESIISVLTAMRHLLRTKLLNFYEDNFSLDYCAKYL